MATPNIHDKFFKDAFTDRNLAADFLRNYLPSHVAKHVNLETLAITKDTFVDKKWDDFYSDLLYTVTFADGRPGFVYFLFEHKSYHSHFLALQMLRYMLETMDISEDNLREMADKALDPGKEDTIMTLAERLRKEGEEKGLQKGLQNGILKERNELFNRLLHKRFGDIRDPHIQERLRKATPDQINRWFDRILEAKSIEEVIEE